MMINDHESFDQGTVQVTCTTHGYSDYIRFPDGHDACITRVGSNFAILYDVDDSGYRDRWCFTDYREAIAALHEWAASGGEGEPNGWQRRINSRHRRLDGDPVTKYINL
jgi:hypothetical protein